MPRISRLSLAALVDLPVKIYCKSQKRNRVLHEELGNVDSGVIRTRRLRSVPGFVLNRSDDVLVSGSGLVPSNAHLSQGG